MKGFMGMTDDPKKIIWLRSRRPGPGDLAADDGHQIDDIYRLHWRELTLRLRSVFGAGPPEPEDLAQEAFARFVELPNYQTIKHPRAFLFRIALNLGFNASKRLGVARRHIERALREADSSLLEEMSPEDVYSSKERIKILIEATQTLSEKQRTVLMRSRIHGETYEQISKATGWSSADISRQLNAALKVIQEKLTEDDGA